MVLKRILVLVGALVVFLAGAATVPIVSAQDGNDVRPRPAVGDRIYVYGHGQSVGCAVTAVSTGDWVLCDGIWRNLVTGAAYVIQAKAR